MSFVFLTGTIIKAKTTTGEEQQTDSEGDGKSRRVADDVGVDHVEGASPREAESLDAGSGLLSHKHK